MLMFEKIKLQVVRNEHEKRNRYRVINEGRVVG